MDSKTVHVSDGNIDEFLGCLGDLFLATGLLVERAIPIVVEYAACAVVALQEWLHTPEADSAEPVHLSWQEAEELGKRYKLTKFQVLAGWLMSEARPRRGVPLTHAQYLEIAQNVDKAGLRPVHCLQGDARKKLAANNRDARKAIHTFCEALGSEEHRRNTLRAFYAAHERWLAVVSLSEA